MVLPLTDRYALILVAFFVMLDGYAELKRPHKQPPPDLRDGNETLQNLRSAAYEEALLENGGRSITCSLGSSVKSGTTSRSVPSVRILFETVQQPEMRRRGSDKIRSVIAKGRASRVLETVPQRLQQQEMRRRCSGKIRSVIASDNAEMSNGLSSLMVRHSLHN